MRRQQHSLEHIDSLGSQEVIVSVILGPGVIQLSASFCRCGVNRCKFVLNALLNESQDGGGLIYEFKFILYLD